MTRRLTLKAALAIAVMLLAPGVGRAADPVQYELRLGRPSTHLLDITIRADGLRGPAAEFAMPAWAPGAYTISNYAKNVQGFEAQTPEGKILGWRKTDKQTWRVDLAGSHAAVIRYKLFANNTSNNWAQYNEHHAILAGPAIWMYLVGGKERPVRLTMAFPGAWRAATGLERAADGSFTAADYDWFADSPIELSNWSEATFTISGTTYHFVVDDLMGHKDFQPFVQDTRKVVEALLPVFSPVAGDASTAAPFRDYWFLMHIFPAGEGGLEHLNSTEINFSHDWDYREPAGHWFSDYEEKLFITAHEFFHAWNVKRLRPRPLGPFDYSREADTPSLWMSEGVTSYYAELALVRAGVEGKEAYLSGMSQVITTFELMPGRAERSIEDASWDTWLTDVPGKMSNLDNTTYSYYDGGQIVAHLLDFAIRQATDNRKSLDDWMRLLYQRHALPKPGFEPGDAVRAASEVAGTDLSDFFARYVSGKEPLPYEKYFAYAGLRVEKLYQPQLPWLGVTSQSTEDGHVRVVQVTPGSPADQAGLDREDIIVALDSRAVGWGQFSRVVAARKPGETVHLSVIHAGDLRDVAVILVSYPYPYYRLSQMEKPSEAQRRIYESWMGQAWDRR